MGSGTRPISGLWQFHTGDDLAWAQPGFDDRGWERIPADQPWGDAGHPGIWGYAWYRREILLDPNSKQPLALLLPPLDSAAEVYWSGEKVGGEGSMPPHPSWFYTMQPVAVSLPPTAGASSGVLAIRIWSQYRDLTDAPDVSGLQSNMLLGYSPLIQKMPVAWTEHRLRRYAISYASNCLCLFTSVAALVLWVRFRSQWVLLLVGVFFGSYALTSLIGIQGGTFAYIPTQLVGLTLSLLTRLSSVGLILLLADLPQRPGLRGARFWTRVYLVVACITLLYLVVDSWATLMIGLRFVPDGRPFVISADAVHFTRAYERVIPFFVFALLAICLLLGKRTLPRVLFMLAVFLDGMLQWVGVTSQDSQAVSHGFTQSCAAR